MSQQDENARVLALTADNAVMVAESAALKLFEGRLPRRIARTLMAAGIGAPEHLLFMSKVEIMALPGMSAAAQREVQVYRSRFIPENGGVGIRFRERKG